VANRYVHGKLELWMWQTGTYMVNWSIEDSKAVLRMQIRALGLANRYVQGKLEH